MRQTKQPVCTKCMKIDFDKGQMKPIDEYFKMPYELVATAKIRDREHPLVIIGESKDYRCPKGHGITVQNEWGSETVAKETVKTAKK